MTEQQKFRSMILGKMRERGIQNLSDAEIERVFARTVAPSICLRAARRMIAEGLTIEEVWQEKEHKHANRDNS